MPSKSLERGTDDVAMHDVSRPRRILVTGAAGFLGSHLCEHLLHRGFVVWGLDNLHPFYDPAIKRRNLRSLTRKPGMHVVEGDVRDGVLLDGLMETYPFDAVAHLAAIPGVRGSLETPEPYLDVNVGGTIALLEAIRRNGPSRLLFASSSSVYGASDRLPYEESDPADRPLSPYAATKRAGELLCHSHHETIGLSVHCTRIFTAYGPRQRPDLAIHKFARLLRDGEALPLYGDGSSERDYTYVDDVVEGLVLSIERLIGLDEDDPEFQIVNLGSGRAVRLDELVDRLGRALGLKPVVAATSPRAGDMRKTLASTDRAGELLGWSPRTSLEEGLRRFADWIDAVSHRPPELTATAASGSARKG